MRTRPFPTCAVATPPASAAGEPITAKSLWKRTRRASSSPNPGTSAGGFFWMRMVPPALASATSFSSVGSGISLVAGTRMAW